MRRRARSFDLEVAPWAPTRLTSCIFHPGPTEAYEPLRSTLCPARTPFRDLAAPGPTRKPPVCRSGISRARSFDLEVTPWAPARLTSCIFHPGPEEASGASTLEPGPAEQFRRVEPPPNRPAATTSLTASLAGSALALAFWACCGRTAPRTAPSQGLSPPDMLRNRRRATAGRGLGRFLQGNIAVSLVAANQCIWPKIALRRRCTGLLGSFS